MAFAGGARGPSRLGYCGATIIKLPLLLYDGLLWAVLVTSVVWCQASVRGVTPGRGVTPVGASVELSAHLSGIAFALPNGAAAPCGAHC